MKCRVKFLVRTYLWTVIVFILAKVAFMLFCREGHEFTFGDMLQVIWHGLSLDLSTSLYIIIVPFLLCIVNIWYWAKWLNILLRGYFILISIALAMAFVADTSLYPFWNFKLDSSCLQYLDTPAEMAASVSALYIIMRILAFAVATIIIFSGYRNLISHSSTSEAAKPSATLLTPRKKLLELCLYIITVPFIIIGIRGGLDESTSNISQVYYSQNQFLNHSAVNPVFCFIESFEKTVSDIVDYNFYTEAECQQIVEGLYPTSSIDTDTLLTTSRPDIIVILMESAGECFAKGMPRLQQLKKEGINFSNCYANSWRTDRGTLCTQSGYPSFPTSSVMKMPVKTRALPGIASTLLKEGYETSYIYGGDINFTNMRGYLVESGFSKLIWKADYSESERHSAEWGVRDDITFNTLLSIVSQPSAKPRFIGYSTLSSHEPWDVPMKKYDDEILNAFYYLDHCIGDFIDKFKQTPQWKNSLIILLPDHSYDYAGANQTQPLRNLIPMVWTGGAIKEPRLINTICNQTDLAATLLAQLGLPHDKFRWSRDILSRSYQHPFAMHTYNNGFSITDSTGFMAFDFNANRIVANKSTDSYRLERIGKAILQATTKDLKNLGK